MNILPQILNYDTKNFIINHVIDKIKHNLSDFFNNLFFDYSKSRYVKNILNMQNSLNKIIKNSIIDFINITDSVYKASDERKSKYYINVSNKERTIYTIFGEITFCRTYYKSKTSDDYYFYIDDLLGLDKYDTYDSVVKATAIDDAVNYNPNNASYHSSLDVMNLTDKLQNNNINQISRQSIYRWIRESKLKEIRYDTINNGNTLYVMVDEKWIHEQEKISNDKKKKYIMSKCFVIFTHIKRKGKRAKLMGRHIFITSSSNPWKELMDEISKIYDFEKITTINLLSDAGNWILSGKDELKLYSHNKVVVNTCEFHVKQKINRSTTDKDLREKLVKSIYDNHDRNEFKKIMDEIIDSKDKQSRKDTITSYRDYILKHWLGILAMQECPYKSSMESHISHCVASKFGSRPKAYSRNNIQVYLKLQEAYLNNINIMDYYLKCYYSDDDFIYNEKEASFGLLNRSSKVLPTVYSGNPISLLLNSIAN